MFFIKLEPNDDIFDSLTEAIAENSIQTGFFTAIGALNTAILGYYLVDQKKYKTITLEGNYEIVSCSGNVSLKDGAPMIHAHLVVADQKGCVFGGHLLVGNKISITGEIFLVEAKKPLIRTLDTQFKIALVNLN